MSEKVRPVVVREVRAVSVMAKGEAVVIEVEAEGVSGNVLVALPHRFVAGVIEGLINASELAFQERGRMGQPSDSYVPNVFEAKRSSAGPSNSVNHVGMIMALPGGGDIGFQVTREDARRLARQLSEWADRSPYDVLPNAPTRSQ